MDYAATSSSLKNGLSDRGIDGGRAVIPSAQPTDQEDHMLAETFVDCRWVPLAEGLTGSISFGHEQLRRVRRCFNCEAGVCPSSRLLIVNDLPDRARMTCRARRHDARRASRRLGHSIPGNQPGWVMRLFRLLFRIRCFFRRSMSSVGSCLGTCDRSSVASAGGRCAGSRHRANGFTDDMTCPYDHTKTGMQGSQEQT